MIFALSDFLTFSTEIQYYFEAMALITIILFFFLFRVSLHTVGAYRSETGPRFVTMILLLVVAGGIGILGNYGITMLFTWFTSTQKIIFISVLIVVIIIIWMLIIKPRHCTTYGRAFWSIFITIVFTAIFMFVILLVSYLLLPFNPFTEMLQLI